MVSYDTLLAEVKKRKEVKHEQALSLLTMAGLPGESETRISFLNLAERQIEQIDVFSAWVSLTVQEQDDVVKRHLLNVLSSFSHSGKFKQAHADLLINHLDTWSKLVEHLSLRVSILNIISSLLAVDGSRVGDKLAQVYDASDAESYKGVIVGLIYYIRHTWKGAPDFLLKRFEDTPLEYRAGILTYLLKRNAAPVADQLRLLSFVPELDYARYTLTRHYLNSTAALPLELEPRFIKLMQEDPVVACRQNAARILIRHGRGITEALTLLKSADQVELRNTLFQELTAVENGNEDFLNALLDFLMIEKDVELIREVLNHLTSKVTDSTAFGDSLRNGLVELTKKNITIEFAELIFKVLGVALRSHPGLQEKFIAAYPEQNRDELRAVILYNLAKYTESNAAIQRLVREALTSKSSNVREAAVACTLTLPVVTSFYPLILEAIPTLTDKDIDAQQRDRLAAKMSVVGKFSEEAKNKIKPLLPFIENREARERLEAGIQNVQSASASDGEPDWDAWLAKIAGEKSIMGIFPAIYVVFDKNPVKARTVMDAVLADRKNLNLGFFSDPLAIFEFLISKGMGDEKLMAWVWEYFLTSNDHAGEQTRRCLTIFKTAPAARTGREHMWKFMERDQVKICGSVALLDTFFILFDGEKKFSEELKQQLNLIVSPKVYSNYVNLFENSSTWPWVKDCIRILIERAKTNPAIVEGSQNSSQQNRIDELCKLLDVIPTTDPSINSVQLQQPGLLDD